MTGERQTDMHSPATDSGVASKPWARTLWQLLRYLGVGLVVMAADYAGFLLCLLLGLTAVLANAVGKVAATIVGCVLHRSYTFAGPQHLSIRQQLVSYILLSVANLILSSILIHGFVHKLGLAALVAKVLTDIVVIVISYLVSKFLIYAPPRS